MKFFYSPGTIHLIYSLFIDDIRLTNGIKEHLDIHKNGNKMLKILPYENIDKTVKEHADKGRRIWVSLE